MVEKMPVGGWRRDNVMKYVGRRFRALLEDGLVNYGLALFTRHLETGVEEAREVCEMAFAEMRERGVHCYNEQ